MCDKTAIVFYEFVKPHASMHNFILENKFLSTFEITDQACYVYRIKHSNKSSQTCIPSSFSIGVIKIMTKPITVVNPIQPRTRYSRVGLLTPWVRRRGRACIRPIVKVDWIFIGNFLKHILSLLFLIENQWLSVIMIF